MTRLGLLGSLALTSIVAYGPGCDREDERAGVSPKLVERAERAAEQTRRSVSQEATDDIHEVASEELDHRLYATDQRGGITDQPMRDLRQQIDQVHVAQSDYIAARDRVVEQARQHLYELAAQANQPHRSGDRLEFDRLRKQAEAELQRLANASAEQWDERSEEAFEAVEQFDEAIGEHQLDARRRAPQGPHDPDHRNAPLRP